MFIGKVIGYLVAAILNWIAAKIKAAVPSKGESDDAKKAIEDAENNDDTSGIFKP